MAIAQPTPLPAPAGPVARLSTAAGELADRDLDVLSDHQLDADLETLEQARRQLEAHQITLASTLKTRQAARQADRGVEAGKAARQADRTTRDKLTNDLHWTPSDARRATRIGGELAAAGTSQEARQRFADGRLSPRHAKLLADTLRHLVGEERDRAEAVLLEAAGREDPVTFARTCRRLLAQLDHDAAMGDEQRRHTRRSARMSPTDDGMLATHALLAGLDAETYATAIHAFRRPDPPGITAPPNRPPRMRSWTWPPPHSEQPKPPPPTASAPTSPSIWTTRPCWPRPASPKPSGWAPCPSARSAGCWPTAASHGCWSIPTASRSRPAPRPATYPTASTAGCCAATEAASVWAATPRPPGAT